MISRLTSFPALIRLKAHVDARLGLPTKSHRPTVGSLVVAAKRGFRGTFQPFINEILDRQTRFNEELLGWGRALSEDIEQLDRNVTHLQLQTELRIGRLEALVERLEGFHRAHGERETP